MMNKVDTQDCNMSSDDQDNDKVNDAQDNNEKCRWNNRKDETNLKRR